MATWTTRTDATEPTSPRTPSFPATSQLERLTSEGDDLASRLDAAATELEQVHDDLYAELDRWLSSRSVPASGPKSATGS